MLGILLLGEAAAGQTRRRTHSRRLLRWLRYRYTIVHAARAAGLRDETRAGRASGGRSEAASASSDPCSKTRFSRMIPVRVDASVTAPWAFATPGDGR